jgi:hypothetical protein
MRAWRLWIFILAFPALCSAAYFYCELQGGLARCESELGKAGSSNRHLREPEVALPPILLADKEVPEQPEAKAESRAVNSECRTVCRMVAGTLHDPVALFTVVLCFIVYLQFLWIARHESVLESSVAAARGAAHTIQSLERAQVYIVPATLLRRPLGRSSDVTVHAVNFGKTPGFLEKIAWDVQVAPEGEWKVPEHLEHVVLVRKLVRPDNHVLELALDPMLGATAPVLFFGRAYFSDVFEQAWSSTWTYRVEGSQFYSLDEHIGLRREPVRLAI